ncbi:hypothetical protein GCM10023085_06830 [Actinomadura viridis]|uniref:Lipoprotein n=1 Tax=Actinomadura viridis TaxID=58110 RepID=A0A931DNA3_9ACTN|nr:hypothetical protein [Actinomadura viridis]MBG6091693.1 hypothetical protein [Actinomadura viridis]
MHTRLFAVVASFVLGLGTASCGGPEKPVSSPRPAATSAEPSKPAKPAGTRIGHYKDIVLSRSFSIDFDDDPAGKRVVDGDLQFFMEIEAHRITLLPAGVRGGYQVCRDRTGRSTALGFKAVSAGRSICVVTESGLVGLFKVRQLRIGEYADRGVFRFDLTVWQGAA